VTRDLPKISNRVPVKKRIPGAEPEENSRGSPSFGKIKENRQSARPEKEMMLYCSDRLPRGKRGVGGGT